VTLYAPCHAFIERFPHEREAHDRNEFGNPFERNAQWNPDQFLSGIFLKQRSGSAIFKINGERLRHLTENELERMLCATMRELSPCLSSQQGTAQTSKKIPGHESPSPTE